MKNLTPKKAIDLKDLNKDFFMEDEEVKDNVSDTKEDEEKEDKELNI